MLLKFSQLLSLTFWTQLCQAILATLKRFPLSSLCLALLAFIFISEIHDFNALTDEQNKKIALLSLAGACWFLAITLLAESKQWQSLKHYTIAISAFALYAWHVFSHSHITLSSVAIALAAALTITFFPWFLRKQHNDSFWYFNFQLISAAFFAGLSALLLSGGLSLILLSIGYLFDIDINTDLYGDIWVLGTVLFGGLYFLSNTPKQVDYSRTDCEQFPSGIQFIQTYVLVPLSLIYMVILYAYFIKILLQWSLPHGHLGMMVSTFGLIGIISHLTIYPVHERTGLLCWFYRHFYLAMIVPLAMLLLAIASRIDQYGLTEKRYILVLIAIWFAILILARLIRKKGFSLSTVTTSFAALCLIASIGPWNIHTLPLDNQFSRLESLLTKEKLLVNGNYKKPTQQPDFEVKKSISSMVDYIMSRDGGLAKLRPWFSDQQALDESLASEDDKYPRRYYDGNNLVSYMGIDYINRWAQEDSSYTNIHINHAINPFILPLKGYDYLVPLSLYKNDEKVWPATPFGDISKPLSLTLTDVGILQITLDNNPQTINIDLVGFVRKFSGGSNIEVRKDELHKMIISHTQANIDLQLYIKSISQIMENNTPQISNLDAYLLLKIGQSN